MSRLRIALSLTLNHISAA